MRWLVGVSVFCFMAAWVFLVDDFVDSNFIVAAVWLMVGGLDSRSK